MVQINVSKINESIVFVECSNTIAQELYNYFSAHTENYRFSPAYKQGRWDGRLRIFNITNHQLPIGLSYKLKEFSDQGKYSISFNYQIGELVSKEEFISFVESLNLPFPPYDYQLKSAYDALRNKHLNIQSVTGSGKSLSIYLVIRWLETKNIKTLLIVPKVQLVEQMFGDFLDYGWEDVEDKCCRIYGGQKRLLNKNVIISTYQSLYADAKKGQIGQDYIDFSSIEALIIDECHSSKNTSINTISKKTFNSSYRIGYSATYPEENSADWFTIVGTTGRIKQYTTYQKLQDDNQIANLKIKVIKLNYPQSVRKLNYETNKGNYADEVNYINLQSSRMDFIVKLISKIEGNTLVFFIKKENQGIPLYNKIKNELPNKKVFYIDGSVSVSDRESIRSQMEASGDVILVGSFGCISEGTNIKRIHNIVFAASYKSEIKVLQSIGRSLRLWNDKEHATLYDLVDNLKYIDKDHGIWYSNSTLEHGKKRFDIYKEQKFEVETIEYNINER